jgi:hypothetical protein
MTHSQPIPNLVSFCAGLVALLGAHSSWAALPDIQCTDTDQGNYSLTLQHTDPNEASAVLSDAHGSTPLKGTYQLKTSSLIAKVYDYELTDPSGKAGHLAVSQHVSFSRGGCRRCGLPVDGTLDNIDAELELGGQTLSFACHENGN